MFEKLKYANNLFNTRNFYKNIGNVEVADHTSSLTNVSTNLDVKNDLKRYFCDYKNDSRNVYLLTNAKVFIRSIPLIQLPIILVLCSYLLISSGSKGTVNLDKYKTTTTKVEQGYVLSQKESEGYYNPNNYNLSDKSINFTNTQSKIDYSLANGESVVTVNLSLNKKGKLGLMKSDNSTGITEEYYVEDLDSTNLEENEYSERYAAYTERINAYLLNSGDLTDEQIQLIQPLVNDEKTRTFLSIVEKEYLGTDKLETRKDIGNDPFPIFFSFLTAIYISLLLAGIYIEGGFKWPTYEENCGRLESDHHKRGLLEALNIRKRELIESEKNRIKRCIEEAKRQGLTEEDIRKILTKFEVVVAEKEFYIEPVKKLTK